MKLRKFRSEKLWRDKTPAMHREEGGIVHVKQLDDVQYDQALRAKLSEEAAEINDAQDRQDLIEEIADVMEVIDALCALHAIEKQEVTTVQDAKRVKRGGFAERQFVMFSEHPEGGFFCNYCLERPDRYPEMLDT